MDYHEQRTPGTIQHMTRAARTAGGRVAYRRRTAADPLRKMGWQVHQSVAEAVKQAVDEGAAESQNVFVEDALIQALKDLRCRRVFRAYAEAAADPAFIGDMRATTAAFDATAGDGLALNGS